MNKYTAVLITFLALCVLFCFGLTQYVYANDNADDVADEFGMEQEVDTSGGTVRRHVDISSAGSGAYVYENTTIVGKAEITDSFSMNNVKPGSGSDQGSGLNNDDFGTDKSANPSADQGNNAANVESDSNVDNTPESAVENSCALEENNNPGTENQFSLELENLVVPEWSDLF